MALALVVVTGALETATAEVFFDSIAGVATTRGVPLIADDTTTAAGVATVVRTRLSWGALETIGAMVTPLLMMMVTGGAQTVQTWHTVCCAAAADVRWVATTLSIALVLETSTAWDLVSWTTVVPFSAALVLLVSWRTTEVDFWFPFSFVLLFSLLLVEMVLFFCDPYK